MITYIKLKINQSSPPFQAAFTLDGSIYNGIVSWNFAGQRWYFTLNDQRGQLVISQPLIGSPMNASNYLLPGLFKVSTLLYRSDTSQFEVTP